MIAVEYAAAHDNFVMLADKPSNEAATFAYFESTFTDLAQYGPTFVFNGYAITDVTVRGDGDPETIEARVLHRPKEPILGEGIGLGVRAMQGQGYFLLIGGEPDLNADVETLSRPSVTADGSVLFRLVKLGPRRPSGDE